MQRREVFVFGLLVSLIIFLLLFYTDHSKQTTFWARKDDVLPGWLWGFLQPFLETSPKGPGIPTRTLLVVSHDADFLDSVCTDVVHLEEGKAAAKRMQKMRLR